MATNTPMLEVRGLHAYYGKSHILHGVDMHVGEGEIVALLGRNGVGRSTLAKSIMGMVRHEGEILLRGKNVSGLRTFEVAHQGIGYVPENRDIFPTLTVRQNLLLGEKRNPNSPKPRWQIDDMYQMFPRLKERENTAAGVLGRRAADADAVPHADGRPGFHHHRRAHGRLGAADRHAGGRIPEDAQGAGISVLLVEQKLAIALDISQRVYVMGHGQIVFEGTPAQLKADAKVRQEWLEV